ncbi:type II secretion system F family protein [Reyranella sp. CPCC 100927]|uniref:type II secretion system F family protein n=1 Tax=Reyranella sp. CPCC 100927 TaxID=2599616 RepID=UPI0011B4D373|nr:type II secretion system F family protein [Reyranella sp. CPCC 100927]TWT10218.1 type II secretion system F family protein [Reyranella sp. CPCC 100927]
MTALEEFFGTTDPTVLMAMVTLAFGLFCAIYFGLFAGREERRARDRLDLMNRRMRGMDSRQAEQARMRLKKVEVDSHHPVLDQLLKRFLPNRDELRARLERTGRRWTVGDYVLVCLVISGSCAAMFYFLGVDLPMALIGGLVLGASVPHAFVGFVGRRRIDRFNSMFPDALDLIVRALRSGIPIQEAVATVGREMQEPIGPLFARVTNEVRLGGSIEDAFWNAANTIRAPEFNFLIISMSIQRETGGNLGETLANLSKLLRDRRQMKLKIRAFSSEARAGAAIVGALPFVVCGAIFVLSPDYIMPLFTDPRGVMMLIIGVCMMATGLFIMKRMATFEI